MRYKIIFLVVILLLSVGMVSAQDVTPEATPQATEAVNPQANIPAATIVNDQGGPVTVDGHLTYTDLNFTLGVGEPEIIFEDEAGYIDHNVHFAIPIKSQVIGELTSDFFTSPVSYTMALPEAPQGDYRDVNHDGKSDQGVQVFAIAYWTNTWGDPYLEKRDLFGVGYSSAYASTRFSANPSQVDQVIGGKYVVYAPDDQQDFPSGFGADGKLFTSDDPLVRLPKGYTVVNMDTNPFTFDRSRDAKIELIEGEASQLQDYSKMSFADAFSGLLEQMRTEYAFTALKHVDWDALKAKYLPEFQKADQDQDSHEYLLALRDFSWSIPDGHIGWGAAQYLSQDFQNETDGGLGMAIRELDDGSVLVNYILPGGPADQAGIKLRAVIKSFNGQPVDQAITSIVPWSSPFSSDVIRKLQQLRYLLRSPVGTKATIVYANPDSSKDQTVTLTSVAERDSFNFSFGSITPFGAPTGFEQPLDYKVLPGGYVYVRIYTFSDNARLTIELWERLMQTLNQQQIPGLIVDMRDNNGGSEWLADQMAAYFFNDALDLGNSETFDKSKGSFYLDPNNETYFIPPDASLQYHGNVAVLVGPRCISACEIFSRNMTLENRAAMVGQYPTEGGGGGITAVLLPGNIYFQFPFIRNLDAQGNIVIEGKGIQPTVKVPVDATTLFAQGDPILDAAVNWLGQQSQATPASP